MATRGGGVAYRYRGTDSQMDKRSQKFLDKRALDRSDENVGSVSFLQVTKADAQVEIFYGPFYGRLGGPSLKWAINPVFR